MPATREKSYEERNSKMDKTALYYWHDSVNRLKGLAIDLHIHDSDGIKYFCWHDTCHGHMMQGTLDDQGDQVTFTNSQGNVIVFTLCTLEAYRRELYRLANNGEIIAAKCKTDAELWTYYCNRLAEDFM